MTTDPTIEDLLNGKFELQMQLAEAKAMAEFHRRGAVLARILAAIGWLLLFLNLAWGGAN